MRHYYKTGTAQSQHISLVAHAVVTLTSFCSSAWGDCGGVITCSLHISSVIPSSNGGGNGTVARGGTSMASYKNQ